MSQADYQYRHLLQRVLREGETRTDRTGVGTLSIFGHQSVYELEEGFPLLTTKKVAWKPIVSELLWFLEGSTDERRLAEILYGKPRDQLEDKKTIWYDNANADYWTKGAYPGDLGRVYGAQWRSWSQGFFRGPLDQIAQLIEGLRKDPFSRRHLVVAYNPGEIEDMALPPCHAMFQFYVRQGRDGFLLDCQLYQRSADIPLGVPFNIASYALLTHMIAQVVDMVPGRFIHSLGDAHIYRNQIDGVKKQLQRAPKKSPALHLNSEIKNINDFKMEDIVLKDYDPHPAITFPFAV